LKSHLILIDIDVIMVIVKKLLHNCQSVIDDFA
jgi:hypothetical protein